MSQCPICEASVSFAENTEVGEIVACNDCGSDLEVASLAPPTVRKAPEVAEDWGE